jgi:L-threonylcarbamoyladenylate synthase
MSIQPATDEAIRRAAARIIAGGVVIYPTETVYGLGCDPADPDASKRICELKERADKPLPLICADMDAARKVVEFNPSAERLAERFWPGPLMLVLPSRVKYPMWVTHGAKTLGVRVSPHPVASKLAKLCGGIIVSTSANKSGQEPPRTAQEALNQFTKKVDMVLDDGPSPLSQSSTVIDLSSDEVWILRKGPVTADQIKEVLGL